MDEALKENFKIIANRIWARGETEFKGQGCLMSSDFHFGYNDDPIIDKYKVTHYDLKWEELGKTVKISLYEGDAFGAAEITGDPKHTEIVKLEVE